MALDLFPLELIQWDHYDSFELYDLHSWICQIEGILRCGHMVMMGHVRKAMRSLRHSFFEVLLPMVIIRTSPSSFYLTCADVSTWRNIKGHPTDAEFIEMYEYCKKMLPSINVKTRSKKRVSAENRWVRHQIWQTRVRQILWIRLLYAKPPLQVTQKTVKQFLGV